MERQADTHEPKRHETWPAAFQGLDPEDLARRLAAIEKRTRQSVPSQLTQSASAISLGELLAQKRLLSTDLASNQELWASSKLAGQQPKNTTQPLNTGGAQSDPVSIFNHHHQNVSLFFQPAVCHHPSANAQHHPSQLLAANVIHKPQFNTSLSAKSQLAANEPQPQMVANSALQETIRKFERLYGLSHNQKGLQKVSDITPVTMPSSAGQIFRSSDASTKSVHQTGNRGAFKALSSGFQPRQSKIDHKDKARLDQAVRTIAKQASEMNSEALEASEEQSSSNVVGAISQLQASDSLAKKMGRVLQKRGRKLTDPVRYFADSELKIKQWKEQLKADQTMSKVQKQKLRNKISAQGSRQNKKQEHQALLRKMEEFRGRFVQMASILEGVLKPEDKALLSEQLKSAEDDEKIDQAESASADLLDTMEKFMGF